MAWIGLRTPTEALLSPGGLGQPQGDPPMHPDHLLPRGSLMVQFSHTPQPRTTNLIRYAARDPWPAGLTLCIDPDGSLRLLQRQSETVLHCVLPTGIRDAGETVLVTYTWDAPARTGVLAAHLPDRDMYFQTGIVAPVPPNLRDIDRLILGFGCTVSPEVVFVAVADHVAPIGPQPGLGGDARIDTPTGPKPIGQLGAGDLIDTVGGDLARIVWAGAVDLPARGRFAPLLLRAPYHGLTADMVARPDQRLHLTGSDVEYLFGEEEVRASIRHLEDGRSVLRAADLLVVRYHQLVLDRPAIIRANGAALESLDIAPLLADPCAFRQSVMAGVPAPMLPRGPRLTQPILRDFEAMTWRRQKAA